MLSDFRLSGRFRRFEMRPGTAGMKVPEATEGGQYPHPTVERYLRRIRNTHLDAF